MEEDSHPLSIGLNKGLSDIDRLLGQNRNAGNKVRLGDEE